MCILRIISLPTSSHFQIPYSKFQLCWNATAKPFVRLFAGVYSLFFKINTQDTDFHLWINPTSVFLSYIGDLGYVFTQPICCFLGHRDKTGCTQPKDAAVGGGAIQETEHVLWIIFLHSILLWWVSMCRMPRWQVMEYEFQISRKLIFLLFPFPYAFVLSEREYVWSSSFYPSQASLHMTTA